MADTMLDIVNEQDEVIGQALRSEIHAKGLLHREIHVWFITPDKNIVFQKRSMSKDTFPGLLDATVGGHVEQGQSYLQAALMEIQEETGINAKEDNISFISKPRFKVYDPVTGMTNNVFRSIYGYVLQSNVSKLQVEDQDGFGFEVFPLPMILNPTKEIVEKIIPTLIDSQQHHIFLNLEKMVSQ